MRVIAVVVSYNRRDLLKACLDALAAQVHPVDDILVIDNASTDDSAWVARNHPAHPRVVALTTNTGGAGGFSVGVDWAIRLGADRVWLMDDDTIPTPTALHELLEVLRQIARPVDLLASRAVWIDGRDHPMNTPRSKWRASREECRLAAATGTMPVRTSSFVSMLVNADTVKREGLPCADMFIWNDDFEFSARMLRRGIGFFVPSSVVEHRTARLADATPDPGERFYYEVRNKIWTFFRSSAFGPLDWLAYVAGTLRRWARTFRSSSHPATLAKVGLQGLRDGLLRSPRPTHELIASALASAKNSRRT